MKSLIAAVCLTILAAPAWAWDAPQSGGVAVQPYHATLSPYAQAYQQALQNHQPLPAGDPTQSQYCFSEHCHAPAPGTCNTEHCHGPAPAQAQTPASTMTGRFAMQR